MRLTVFLYFDRQSGSGERLECLAVLESRRVPRTGDDVAHQNSAEHRQVALQVDDEVGVEFREGAEESIVTLPCETR